MAAKGARVHIYGDWDGAGVKRAQQDISAFQKQATGFSGAISKSMLGVGAAMGGAFAIGNLVGNAVQYLQDAAKAAMEDEKSVVALSVALGNLGLAHKQAGVEDFVSSLQMATGVADTDLRRAYQTLVTATGDVSQAQELLTTSVDASVQTQRSLESVSLAVAKASQGQVSALRRLGIPLDDVTIKTKNFSAAVATMNEKFGGAAAAAGESYAGKLARINEAASEAQETIGYALVDAVDRVSEAFGGVGGAQDAISFFGDGIAGIITAVGEVTGELADLIAPLVQSSDAAEEGGNNFAQMAFGISGLIPVLGPLVSATGNAVIAGNELTDSLTENRRTVEGLQTIWGNYKASLDPAVVAQREAADSAEAAKQALDDLKAAQQRLDDQLSKVSARLEFGRWLRDLDEQLKGNARTFKGWSDGARENQDALLEGWQAAKEKTDAFFKGTTVTAEEWQTQFARNAKKVVQAFVDDGFKPKDIRAFLKDAGLWQSEFANLLGLLTRGQSAAAARQAGMAAGDNVWKAYVAALNAGQSAAYQAGHNLGAASNRGAQDALEIESPSKVFYRNGQMVVAGLTTALADGEGAVAQAITTVVGAASKAAKEVIQGQIGEYVGIVDQARGAIESMATGIVDQVVGNIDFSTTNADGTPMTPEQMMAAMFGDINQQNAVVAAISSNIGTAMPPQLLQQMLSMDPAAAIALADYLGMHPDMLTRLQWNYARLQEYTYNTLGIPMGQTWATIGGESAMAMIDKAMEYIADNAKEFRRWVRSNLNTSITVTVDYVVGQMPSYGGQRANGGPVSAGRTYLVGERGPELLTMGAGGGFVTSNDDLRSASGKGGNTYSISVQAGVGDPRQIGQQVVECIRRYESANGRVFAAA